MGRAEHENGEAMKAIWAVAVAPLICGCASQYSAPTSGPTAVITLSTAPIPAGSWTLVQNFDNETCAPSPHGTRLATFTTTAVQGSGDPHSGVQRIVAAGRPAVIAHIFRTGAAGFTETTACAVTHSFVPIAGARYRVAFGIGSARCGVAVLREDGNDPRAVEDLRQITPVCHNGMTG